MLVHHGDDIRIQSRLACTWRPLGPADSTTTLGKHRQESVMAGFQLVFRPVVEIVIAVDELEEFLLPLLWVVARKVKENSTTGESKFCPWLVLFQLCHIDALLVLKAISHAAD